MFKSEQTTDENLEFNIINQETEELINYLAKQDAKFAKKSTIQNETAPNSVREPTENKPTELKTVQPKPVKTRKATAKSNDGLEFNKNEAIKYAKANNLSINKSDKEPTPILSENRVKAKKVDPDKELLFKEFELERNKLITKYRATLEEDSFILNKDFLVSGLIDFPIVSKQNAAANSDYYTEREIRAAQAFLLSNVDERTHRQFIKDNRRLLPSVADVMRVLRKPSNGLINYKLDQTKDSLGLDGFKEKEKRKREKNVKIHEWIVKRLQNIHQTTTHENQNEDVMNNFEEKILQRIDNVQLAGSQVIHKNLLYTSRVDCVCCYEKVNLRFNLKLTLQV